MSETDDYVHPEQRNLVHDLDEEDLGEIAQTCLEEFRFDEESRTEWVSMHAEWLRLYFQRDRPKNPPWEGSSEESLPLLAEACNQFHSRAYPGMFPGAELVKAKPIGRPDPAAKERAIRVGRHMSWQLLVKDPSYKRNKDRLLLSMPLHGSFFTKTYHDPVRKRNVVENVRASDLVVPYGTGPRELEDLDRKTHVIWMTVNATRILAKKGFFMEAAEPFELDEKSETDKAHDEAMGLQESAYADKVHCKILEQHRLLDLDGDGIEEPYIVWVDWQGEKVLRIAIRYDTDELGNPTDDKEPVEYFTHYPFLENPDGFYGLGYGHLIGQLNIAVNKLLRQSVDAGTMANVANHSGFINKQVATKKGEIRLQLGKFIQTESPIEDIARGIWTPSFPGASATLLQIMELLMGRSDRLAMVTEALTGQTDKVMQPTALLALVEQGLQVFSAAFERVVAAQSQELGKIYRLNRKFMDPQEYFSVLDVDGKAMPLDAGRADYEADHQVMALADPKQITKQQKLAKAQAEYQTLMANPLTASSPPHIYNATRRFLEAIESEDIDDVLPKPTNNLPRTDDASQENMGAMLDTPMVPMVFPDQDHAGHIKAHQEALAVPRMGQAGYWALADHIQSHLRYMGYGGAGLGPQAVPPAAGNGMAGRSPEGAFQPGQPGDLEGGGLMGADQPIEGPASGAGGPGGPDQ